MFMFKISFFVGVLFILTSLPTVYAYEVINRPVTTPYDVYTIEVDPHIEQVITGTLDNFPEMYEVTSQEDFLLTVEIRAVPGTTTDSIPDLNGIIVRQKTRGVEEVARLQAEDGEWPLVYDHVTGLSYRVGTIFSQSVTAGTYHIEVNTPQNIGKYMLVIGNQPQSVGYVTSLKSVSDLYLFYGVPRIFMIRSPFVYYPFGIVVIIICLSATWYWRRQLMPHA